MCYLFCYLAHYLGLYIPGNSICIVDSIMPENLVKYVFFFIVQLKKVPGALSFIYSGFLGVIWVLTSLPTPLFSFLP